MVIRTEATLALYCPHCGKLHMHDFNRFNQLSSIRRQLVCSCGNLQAVISGMNRRQYLLDIPCVLCNSSHKIHLDSRRFWHAQAEKLYCAEENVEIGLYGDHKVIEETFAAYKNEFAQICEDDLDGESVDNLHVMFEIFNRVHDLAEQGHIDCGCGIPLIDTQLYPAAIDLTCRQCGGRRIIPASTEEHLEEVKSWESISLVLSRQNLREQ